MIVKPLTRAKIALFNEKNELLILRRSSTDPIRPGRFDFPGGGIDEGESPTQAVLRETQEEVGIPLLEKDVELAFTSTIYYDDQSSVRFLYVGRIKSNQPIALSHEHDAYEWVQLEEALKKYDHPAWIEGLKYLIAHDQLQL